MPYIGTSPSNGVRRVYTYTATASQTTFSGASNEGSTLAYVDNNYLDVYQNGILLGSADYTSTNGTSVVLAQAASVDDIIVIVAYDVFSVADTVSKTDGGTFDTDVAFTTAIKTPTIKAANGETGITIADNGSVEAYHDNSAKLATNSFGATVTGYLHQTAPVVSIMSHTSQISIPDNSSTVIPFQTSDVDTHGLYDATNDRLLITSAFNGHYFQITWAVAVTGGTNGDNMFGSLRKNGGVIQNDNIFLTGDEGEQITFQGTWIGTVATNDYFDCIAFSDQSSGTKNSLTGLVNSFLTAIKIF